MASGTAVTRRNDLARVADLGAAGLLAYSAFVHLLFPGRFAEAVANYRLLPFEIGVLVAGSLPALQLALAAALTRASLAPAARLGAGCLGVAFLAAQGSAAARGLEIGCGCFGGPEAGRISLASAAPAAGLAFLGFLALRLCRAKEGVVR